MPSERQSTSTVRVAFSAPLDLRASLAPLGRAGDDLTDRWDGATVVRTVSLPADERRVAYAGRVHGGLATPSLEVCVPADRGASRDEVVAALRATLLVDRAALADLARRDGAVARLVAAYPGLVPVLFPDPFAALLRSISAQQVNLPWAATVRARLARSYGTRHQVGPFVVWAFAAQPLADADVGELRSLQLTTAKARAVIGCARAAVAGELRAPDLAALTDDQLIAHLTALPGIGRWSAEWFLARTLGQPRIVAGDLGVRKAVGRLYDAAVLPTEIEVRRLTEHWGTAATHAQALVLHDLAEAPVAPRAVTRARRTVSQAGPTPVR